MTASRQISFPLHTVVELSLGLLLLVAPVILHVSTMGIVLGVVLGAVVMGVAMNGSGIMDGHPERPPLSLTAHQLVDAGIGVVLAAAAVVMLLSGDVVAALTFAAGAVAAKSLALVTRYTPSE